MGLDQAALLCLQIAAGDGGEVDAENGSQAALRRQAIARRQPAVPHVGGDEIGDGQIARSIAAGQIRRPFEHSDSI